MFRDDGQGKTNRHPRCSSIRAALFPWIPFDPQDYVKLSQDLGCGSFKKNAYQCYTDNPTPTLLFCTKGNGEMEQTIKFNTAQKCSMDAKDIIVNLS